MNNIVNFFNSMAARWDELCIHDANKIQTLINLISIKKQSRILDVGCGTGILESFLLEYEPEKIIAIDMADKMIEEAKKKYDDKRIDFICTDVMKIENEQYDYIIIYSAFPHFKDPNALIGKTHSLLKPNGKLIICHSESRYQINKHHETKANEVSNALPKATTLAEMMNKHFDLEIIIDNESYYMVVGKK